MNIHAKWINFINVECVKKLQILVNVEIMITIFVIIKMECVFQFYVQNFTKKWTVCPQINVIGAFKILPVENFANI